MTALTEKVEMTADEKAKFEKWQAEEKEKARLAKQQEERETYKELVDEAIQAVFPSGRILSQLFSATKKRIYDSFREVIKLKEEIYGVKEGQNWHTEKLAYFGSSQNGGGEWQRRLYRRGGHYRQSLYPRIVEAIYKDVV